jgi:prevent-host-death family protein
LLGTSDLVRKEITIMSTVSIAEASRELSQLINRAAYGRDVVVLTSRGQPKAVLIGIEAFDQLIGMREHADQPLLPDAEFRQKFRAALAEAGYDSTEKIVALVREIRREKAVEAGRLLTPLASEAVG